MAIATGVPLKPEPATGFAVNWTAAVPPVEVSFSAHTESLPGLLVTRTKFGPASLTAPAIATTFAGKLVPPAKFGVTALKLKFPWPVLSSRKNSKVLFPELNTPISGVPSPLKSATNTDDGAFNPVVSVFKSFPVAGSIIMTLLAVLLTATI